MTLKSTPRSVLSCVCIQTGRVDHYGQGRGYATRGLLVYDGIHYDPLAIQLDGLEGQAGVDQKALRAMDVTLFQVQDDDEAGPAGAAPGGGGGALAAAQALGKIARERREFTNTGSFTLRCLVCQQGLTGQEAAVAHATATGHQNFSQY